MQQAIKAKHWKITKVAELTIGMFITENHQFSYRVIISAKAVARLQTAALQKSGVITSRSQQFTGNAQEFIYLESWN